MKLLLDHHLSPRLVKRLANLFPESNHIYPLNLDKADDFEIWEFAKENNFIIVTKDADFSDLSTRAEIVSIDEAETRPLGSV